MTSNNQPSIPTIHRLGKKIFATTTVIVAIIFAFLSSERVVASTTFSSSRSLVNAPLSSRSSLSVFGITLLPQERTAANSVFPPSSSLLLSLRGGSDIDELSEDEEDEYDSDVDESDDEELFEDFEMGDGDDEDDFGEENWFDQTIAAFHKTPPLTKAYLTASFAATALGYSLNNNEFPKIFLLEWKPIVTRLQLWRPITAFFNFGGFGLGYILTVHFVWTYMSTLERLHHRKPYDFWIMIIFGMTSMVIGYSALSLSPKFLGHNLSTFLVYVWSRYHEGVDVSMFDLFHTKAELLPWFFLAQTFLLEGELPTLDFLGIAFGHIYHHCKTVGLLRAPESFVKWYTNSNATKAIRDKYKQISSDFELVQD